MERPSCGRGVSTLAASHCNSVTNISICSLFFVLIWEVCFFSPKSGITRSKDILWLFSPYPTFSVEVSGCKVVVTDTPSPVDFKRHLSSFYLSFLQAFALVTFPKTVHGRQRPVRADCRRCLPSPVADSGLASAAFSNLCAIQQHTLFHDLGILT